LGTITIIIIIIIIITISHELGLERLVSASSASVVKVLPIILRPCVVKFSIIFGILLFTLVSIRSQTS